MLTVSACSGVKETAVTLNIQDWATFQQRFITDDGRVIDHAQHSVTHSEGQAYAMFLAVEFDDPDSFELLWQWTRTHLMVRADDGLVSWLWREEEHRVLDLNNATDADVFVAWALERAAKKWGRDDYHAQAGDLSEKLSVLQRNTEHGLFLRPGADGFAVESGLVLNPSYWVFPAYLELPKERGTDWDVLHHDAVNLIKKSRFGAWQLPPDWLFLSDTGAIETWADRPARFGYDAIRIPLFLAWAGHRDELLPFVHYWGLFSMQGGHPDFVDLESDQVHFRENFFAVDSIYRFCQHVLHKGEEASFPKVKWYQGINSYEAALQLLTQIAWLEFDLQQARGEKA